MCHSLLHNKYDRQIVPKNKKKKIRICCKPTKTRQLKIHSKASLTCNIIEIPSASSKIIIHLIYIHDNHSKAHILNAITCDVFLSFFYFTSFKTFHIWKSDREKPEAAAPSTYCKSLGRTSEAEHTACRTQPSCSQRMTTASYQLWFSCTFKVNVRHCVSLFFLTFYTLPESQHGAAEGLKALRFYKWKHVTLQSRSTTESWILIGQWSVL